MAKKTYTETSCLFVCFPTGLDAFPELKAFRSQIHFLLFFLLGPRKPVGPLPRNGHIIISWGKGKAPWELALSSQGEAGSPHRTNQPRPTQGWTCLFRRFSWPPDTSCKDVPTTRCPWDTNRRTVQALSTGSCPSEVQQKPPNLGQVFWFQIVTQLVLIDPHMMALLLGLGKVSSP